MRYPFTLPAITIEKNDMIIDGVQHDVWRGKSRPPGKEELVCLASLESGDTDHGIDAFMEEYVITLMLKKLREE